MLKSDILNALGEINQDTTLPMQSNGEIGVEYVNKTYPGLIDGLTSHLFDVEGLRIKENIIGLKEAGYHTFATARSTDKDVSAGRVRTDKGVILLY